MSIQKKKLPRNPLFCKIISGYAEVEHLMHEEVTR